MADAALPIVQSCRTGLEIVSDWLRNVDRPERMSNAGESRLAVAIRTLQEALENFETGRLQILLPFRHLFDPNHPPIDLTRKVCKLRRQHSSR